MATLSRLPHCVFLVSIIVFEVFGGFEVKLSRRKRYLDLPKGSALAVTLAISTFLPKDVVPEKIQNGYGHIIEYDFLYPFPDRLTLMKAQQKKKRPQKKKKEPELFLESAYSPWTPEYHPHIELSERRKWKRPSRKGKALEHLSQFISRQGYDGDSCVNRLACEATAHLYWGRSLIDDIILLLLPKVSPEGCTASFKECSLSPLHVIMHSTPIG